MDLITSEKAFRAEQQKAKRAGPQPEKLLSDWDRGLCEACCQCPSPCTHSGCFGLFCYPCALCVENKTIFYLSKTSPGGCCIPGTCMIVSCSVLMCFPALLLIHMQMRQRIRFLRRIHAKRCEDCCTVVCCSCCAFAQEMHEVGLLQGERDRTTELKQIAMTE